VRPITIRNFGRIILTTNNDNCVQLEQDERRWVAFKTSNEQANKVEYFKPLIEYFESKENQKAIYEYLLGRNIEDVDWVNSRPKTALYTDIQSMTIPVEVRFINDWVYGKNGDAFGNAYEFSGELYTSYKTWLSRCSIKSEMSLTKFGTVMKKYERYGVTWDNATGRVRYTFNLVTVRNYLKDVGLGSAYMILED
jgi:hypothetical protein